MKSYCWRIQDEVGLQPQGTRPYFGIEFELDGSRNTDAYELGDTVEREFDGIIYSKDDDSVVGPECITQPIGAKKIINDDFFKSFFELLNRHEAIAFDRTGMHIHTGKDWLTLAQMRRLYWFVMTKNYGEFFIHAGGRNTTGSYYSIDSHERVNDLRKGHNTEKYRAIRWTGSTVEFRFPAMTTDYTKFLERVDFVYSLIMFTKNPIKSKGTMGQYVEWLAENRKMHYHAWRNVVNCFKEKKSFHKFISMAEQPKASMLMGVNQYER